MVFCRQGGYRDVCVRARETRLEAFMNGWNGPYFRGEHTSGFRPRVSIKKARYEVHLKEPIAQKNEVHRPQKNYFKKGPVSERP